VIQFMERPESTTVAGTPQRPPLHLAPEQGRDFKKRFSRTYMKTSKPTSGTMSDLREPEARREILERELVQKIERHMGDMPPRVPRFPALRLRREGLQGDPQALGTSVANAECRPPWAHHHAELSGTA